MDIFKLIGREAIFIIAYLTSNENIGLFDFLEKEQGKIIKKLVGQFSIRKFSKYNIRSLTHYSYLVVDMTSIEEDLDIIIENLIAIDALYNMRIILLADELEGEDIKEIVEKAKIYNIITETKLEGIKEEMELCISPQGITREYINKKINSEYGYSLNINNYIFRKDTKIAIIGTERRIGTTTMAINIATYLEEIGARVSYTEANPNNHLQTIHSILFQDNSIKDNYFRANGIDYFFNFNIPSTNYDFNIIDLGEIDSINIAMLKDMVDEIILCSGIRPYEIINLNKSINKLKDIENYNILLPKGDMTNMKNYILGHENYTIHRTEYSSSLFDSVKNKKIWREILSSYIVPHSSQTA